eukprot:m.240800 g.240800  ORF g.240800 m.240800 type:complete len:583 (-) comp13730_c0_seq1:630-2378(-)
MCGACRAGKMRAAHRNKGSEEIKRKRSVLIVLIDVGMSRWRRRRPDKVAGKGAAVRDQLESACVRIFADATVENDLDEILQNPRPAGFWDRRAAAAPRHRRDRRQPDGEQLVDHEVRREQLERVGAVVDMRLRATDSGNDAICNLRADGLVPRARVPRAGQVLGQLLARPDVVLRCLAVAGQTHMPGQTLFGACVANVEGSGEQMDVGDLVEPQLHRPPRRDQKHLADVELAALDEQRALDILLDHPLAATVRGTTQRRIEDVLQAVLEKRVEGVVARAGVCVRQRADDPDIVVAVDKGLRVQLAQLAEHRLDAGAVDGATDARAHHGTEAALALLPHNSLTRRGGRRGRTIVVPRHLADRWSAWPTGQRALHAPGPGDGALGKADVLDDLGATGRGGEVFHVALTAAAEIVIECRRRHRARGGLCAADHDVVIVQECIPLVAGEGRLTRRSRILRARDVVFACLQRELENLRGRVPDGSHAQDRSGGAQAEIVDELENIGAIAQQMAAWEELAGIEREIDGDLAQAVGKSKQGCDGVVLAVEVQHLRGPQLPRIDVGARACPDEFGQLIAHEGEVFSRAFW